MKYIWKRGIAAALTLCVLCPLMGLSVRAAESPLLNSAHVSYIQGMGNGTFQPDSTLTRAQTAQMVFRLLAPGTAGGSYPCSYQDVAADAWYAVAVRTLCTLGLLEDGAFFRPDDPMTRGELADLLAHFYPQEAEGSVDAEESETAAEEGYIQPEDVARLKAFRDNPSDESWIGK